MGALKSLLLAGLFAGVTFGQAVPPDGAAAEKPSQQPGAASGSQGASRLNIEGFFADQNARQRTLRVPGGFVSIYPLPWGTAGPAEPEPRVCAVPLLRVPIPKDTRFSMRLFRPGNVTAHMPRAKVPAPPCPESR